MFKCEEIDLENFDLAEALVMEVVKNCFEQSSKKENDELGKVNKKRKLNNDCDTNTKIKEKENVYKKQKLENLQHQEAATPPTTPGPIGTFLEGFKFKTKIKKQDNIFQQNPQNPPPPEEKNKEKKFHVKIRQIEK